MVVSRTRRFAGALQAAHVGGNPVQQLGRGSSLGDQRDEILGAGVAGLQAIATAKRLGAVIEVFDTRPAVKEEVMSLGAKFIEVEGAADASKAGGYAVEQTEEYKKHQLAMGLNRILDAFY